MVTGKVVCHSSVNVNYAIMVGKKQMETFEQSWPEGFHDTIPRKVVTMSVGRKSMKVGDAKVFDTETMYARPSKQNYITGILLQYYLLLCLILVRHITGTSRRKTRHFLI